MLHLIHTFFSVVDVALEEDEIQEQQEEVDMPVELEIRLKKEAKRKRKFKPITSNKRRKDRTYFGYAF